MRILSFIVLVILSFIEIGPVPISPVVLIWVVLFRPVWFYEWVHRIYNKN